MQILETSCIRKHSLDPPVSDLSWPLTLPHLTSVFASLFQFSIPVHSHTLHPQEFEDKTRPEKIVNTNFNSLNYAM